jgi:2-polyprenyl-3-methyl-5-hydroxy-6-metoxy-1,4-benzoquinol methylase
MSSNNSLNQDNNLASQQYWDNAYASYEFANIDNNSTIKDWIIGYIPNGVGKSCFEIGCFPGRFLTLFGDLGYELNGIDLTPRVQNDFPNWLKSVGYKTGEFYMEDFFCHRPKKKYDIVASFGFIEHFKNWDDVFQTHLNWVEDEGYLVVETPNFSGWLQRLLHYSFDLKNYRRHYVQSMDPIKWRQIAEDNGFEILYCGYFGEFEFWVDEPPQSWFRRKLMWFVFKAFPMIKMLPKGRKAYSPYCGIIAKKSRRS